MKKKLNEPILFETGISYDDRGYLEFSNELSLKGIERYYIINNYNSDFIRAWHAHKKEIKIFKCISGAFQISVVKIDNFKKPSKHLKVSTWFLSSRKSDVLFLPAGYANGTKSLEQNSSLLVLSNLKLRDSIKDDYRFRFNYWGPWKSNFR